MTIKNDEHLSTMGSCFSVLTIEEQETLSRLLRKVGTHVANARRLRAGNVQE